MEEISQEFVLSITFRNALNRESLLLKKYEDYKESNLTKETRTMIREHEQIAKKHMDIMRDKMIKLGIK